MTRTHAYDFMLMCRLGAVAVVMLALLLVLAGCGPLEPRIHIDYANTVNYNGIMYGAQSQQFGRALTEGDLGPVQFKVTFCLQESQQTPVPPGSDGIAGQLPVGTPLHAVTGYVPAFRLAAASIGRIILYEAQTSANAHSGADLLDIAGKVTDIRIISERDGKMVLATIARPADVAALMALVLGAPVRSTGVEQAPAQYDLVFDLRDGTAVEREYYQDSGQLGLRIMTPAAFGHALDAAVSAQAGTPQPTITSS